MITEGFEQYYKLSKNFMNPLNNDVSKTVLELCRRVNQGALEIAGDNLNRTAEQMKRFSSVKRPEELLTLQKECLTENLSAVMSDIQKWVTLSLGSFEEVSKNFSSHLKDQAQSNLNPGGNKGTEKNR